MKKNNEMENLRQQGMQNNMQTNIVNGQSGISQNPYINQQQNQVPNIAQPNSMTDSLLGSFSTEDFIKGALIGAVGAYLLTNETAQKAIFKGVAKTTSMFQAGMEEMKERFEDAQAELEVEQEV